MPCLLTRIFVQKYYNILRSFSAAFESRRSDKNNPHLYTFKAHSMEFGKSLLSILCLLTRKFVQEYNNILRSFSAAFESGIGFPGQPTLSASSTSSPAEAGSGRRWGEQKRSKIRSTLSGRKRSKSNTFSKKSRSDFRTNFTTFFLQQCRSF